MTARHLLPLLGLTTGLLLLPSCGGDKPTAPPRATQVQVSLNQAACQGVLCTAAVGQIISVSTNWASNTISLNPGSSVAVDVPAGGAYRIYFQADTDCADPFGGVVTWDFTINAAASQTTGAPMTCGP
jgi:hypothetical protein